MSDMLSVINRRSQQREVFDNEIQPIRGSYSMAINGDETILPFRENEVNGTSLQELARCVQSRSEKV